MSLIKKFNQFAGKIVQAREANDMMEKYGLSENDFAAMQGQVEQALTEMEKAGEEEAFIQLLTGTASACYITPAGAAKVEKMALRAASLLSAMGAMQQAVQQSKSDVYLDIEPFITLNATMANYLTDEKKETVNAYIKAMEEAPDHREKLPTLLPLVDTMKKIQEKAVKKFGA